MTRIAAALAALALTASVFLLAVYGPQWILHAPYIHDLSFENVRAHGLPKWWHNFHLIVLVCSVCAIGFTILRRRAKRAAKEARR